MLQSPPLANILPFHHAAVHAAVHAAQQHHQQQQQDTSPQSSSTGSTAGKLEWQNREPEFAAAFMRFFYFARRFPFRPLAGYKRRQPWPSPASGIAPTAPSSLGTRGSKSPRDAASSSHASWWGFQTPDSFLARLFWKLYWLLGQFPPGHGPHPHFGMDHFRPRVLFRMPRVVPNQKEKFETDDLMKRHAREGEVRKLLHFYESKKIFKTEI